MSAPDAPDIHIDADFDVWLPIPTEWPWQDYPDVHTWADTVARAFGDAYDWSEQTRQWCIDAVTALSVDAPDDETRLAIIDPDANWVFFTAVLWSPTDATASVEELAGAGDDSSLRGVELVPFVSPTLGEGIRGTRYVDDESSSHDVVGMVQHAFRAKGLDIVVMSSGYDLLLLQELVPALDDLARSISVG
ncbi:hypothetical protein [Demequina sp. NBRC 110057]|uniref:hypothetical protein n=1 Tax=Demequina sp. NBRC 110057 TaxID=1570346 RepID=UPI000A038FD2|nr:hypothetical protein [Demequina sp. NBRC 110057]